VWVSKEEYRRK